MTNDLLKLGSAALKKAALNEEAKNYILQNENLFTILKKAANRYIGGETLEETVIKLKHLNRQGYVLTTDFMGESIRNEKEAKEATAEFLRLTRAIQQDEINSSISLDLSHIGLLVSADLVKENLHTICVEAAKANQEVIISMEGTDRTDSILTIYEEALQSNKNLGITMQAYLYRTQDDWKHVMNLGGSIRLVKGAYATPTHLSMPRGEALDEVYLQYAEQLLANNYKCAIASHDEKIFQQTIRWIDKYQPSRYVLERLLGIGNEELALYKDKGYQCRMYVVYGKEWYLYVCNRWAEYPLNLFRGLADMLEMNENL